MTRCADCEGKGNKCDHCGGAEVCGAREECGNYELKAAQLQVAAEFCTTMLRIAMPLVRLHSGAAWCRPALSP
jgi:hypothetical protein